jgi:hypothetical protein
LYQQAQQMAVTVAVVIAVVATVVTSRWWLERLRPVEQLVSRLRLVEQLVQMGPWRGRGW